MSYHYGEIPISKVTKNGLKNLLKIEERLFKRVIGLNNHEFKIFFFKIGKTIL